MHQILCSFLCVFCLWQLSSIDANSGDYKVTIIHSNDLFSAFSGVKADNSLCDVNDDLKECIGGAPKIVAKIRELRSKEFVVFVNAGNNLGGFWYKQYGPRVVSDFFGELQFDVIALGLSDFELSADYFNDTDSFNNINEFLRIASLSSRIVSCNIQADDNYIKNFYSSVRKSATVGQFTRHKIGVIGFAKPPTSIHSTAFDYLNIKDPIKCLQEESERLRRDGHEIIFAVGSGDQHLFQEIANIQSIDLVIGSYGSTKDLSLLNERKSDSYPDYIFNGTNGDKIIVTSDVFGKSVGKLSLIFDGKGNIKSSKGILIRMDEHIEDSDDKTNKLVADYQKGLHIGTTRVYLNGSDCSTRECNLGNLISDSMVFYHTNKTKAEINPSLVQSLKQMIGNDVLKEETQQSRDVIALINSQIIHNSIGNVNTPEYIVTKVSLDKIFDKRDPKIQIVILRGKTIRQLLETYFQRSDLLQVSGLRVTYDVCQPINHSIIEISVKCTQCSNDSWNQLDDNKLYDVLLPQSIQVNQYNESIQVQKDLSAFHILESYIGQITPINTSIENRIQMIEGGVCAKTHAKPEEVVVKTQTNLNSFGFSVNKEKNDAFGAKTQILMTLFSTLIAVCHLRYYN